VRWCRVGGWSSWPVLLCPLWFYEPSDPVPLYRAQVLRRLAKLLLGTAVSLLSSSQREAVTHGSLDHVDLGVNAGFVGYVGQPELIVSLDDEAAR